jgi:hypothetical protein
MKCWQPTITFTATVGRTSHQRHINTSSIVLHNVTHADGVLFRDHCWIKLSKRITAANLSIGDRIEFQAQIKFYANPDSLHIKKVGLSNVKHITIL